MNHKWLLEIPVYSAFFLWGMALGNYLSLMRFRKHLLAFQRLSALHATLVKAMKKKYIMGLRSPNYAAMSPEEQWDEDKRLGILDWDAELWK